MVFMSRRQQRQYQRDNRLLHRFTPRQTARYGHGYRSLRRFFLQLFLPVQHDLPVQRRDLAEVLIDSEGVTVRVFIGVTD
jgi:hypothetical protein